LWGPPSLLTNSYSSPFPWGRSDWCMKLTNHFHLGLKLRMCDTTPPTPLYNFMVWWLRKWQFYLYIYFYVNISMTRFLTFKNKYGLLFTSQNQKETYLQFAPFLMELGENQSE
jgi:hypothetical protein